MDEWLPAVCLFFAGPAASPVPNVQFPNKIGKISMFTIIQIRFGLVKSLSLVQKLIFVVNV